MLQVQLQKNKSTAYPVGMYCVGMYHDQSIGDIQQALPFVYPALEQILESRKFCGNEGQVITLPIADQFSTHLVIVGLGKLSQEGFLAIENYRRAVAKAVRSAVGLYALNITFVIPSAKLFNASCAYLVEQTVIIGRMSTYHFDTYITDQDRKEHVIEKMFLYVNEGVESELVQSIEKSMLIATGVNKTRHWIDTPPLDATPLFLAEKAKEVSAKNNLKITVFDEKQIIEMGMGGLAAVSRGSDVDCQFVVMEYHVDLKAPTIALVGKGITFDSGGLSLKPAASMETMKDDMSGAAAVINTMEIIAQLKPKVNVIGLTPMSENLPSGKAIKPGDIIRFYNGKTAEIKNTDAEGRLILADALSYAVKHYKPDAIIDIATLTGACAHALGPYFSGLMSQHDQLVQKIESAALSAGDYVWRLPMTNDYKRAIKSDVADICNIGDNRIKAGAVTAAHFLQHFVEDVPWAHLDIAGTAFDVPNIPYFRSGATGAGVRLFVELVMNW